MEKKIINLVFFTFIIVVTIFMVFTVYYVIHFKDEFTKDPLIFGADKYGVECTCTKWDEAHQFAVVQFGVNSTSTYDVMSLIGRTENILFNTSFTNITITKIPS